MSDKPAFYKFRRWKYHWQVRFDYRRKINLSGKQVKVVIGAGTTDYNDWISTDYPFFDVTKSSHWRFLFKKNRPHNLLAEHVLEHLTEQQVWVTLENAFTHLAPKGRFRLAVPDKNHPNPDYIEYVRPGGSGPGCDDHWSFWDYFLLSELARSVGFEVTLIEYYDENENFVMNDYNLEYGEIIRSKRNPDSQKMITDYSSLIVDLIKL